MLLKGWPCDLQAFYCFLGPWSPSLHGPQAENTDSDPHGQPISKPSFTRSGFIPGKLDYCISSILKYFLVFQVHLSVYYSLWFGSSQSWQHYQGGTERSLFVGAPSCAL